MPGSPTTPDLRGARSNASRRVAFRLRKNVGVRDKIFSGLDGWPVHSPADASPPPLRATAHGLGPMWIATPSSYRTCTDYSLPVSRRTAKHSVRHLLEILDDRQGRGSTIVTSQVDVKHWHDMIANPTVADAILDRLVHNAHRLTLKGESMRKTAAKRAGLDVKQDA